LIDLAERARGHELLDEGVPDEEARRSLADLRFVNRWLGNARPFVSVVRPFLEASPRPRLLDVGCGSADVPALLVHRIESPLLAVGVDVKVLHLQAAPPDVQRVAADVRSLPFPPQSFDVVTASLFLHHFHGQEVADVLRALWALARRALVVNDLRRARVPYEFGRMFFPLLFRSQVSVLDGLLSIRRGFTRDELRAAFTAAGIPVRIRRTFPYRLLAVAEKPAA